MSKALSKSRYTAFCQCPKNLWLKVYKPEEAKDDPALQARLEQGNEVGALAMGLFGDFKEVPVKNPDRSLDLNKMCELTQQYMEQGVDNICEASFSHKGHYCAVDILRRNGDGWDIYEVKSSSFPECDGEETKLEKYAPDIAYQKWVLTRCGVKVVNTYLVCLNSSYVRHGKLDIKSLFVTIDMHDWVENECLKVPVQSSQALKILGMKDEPDYDLSEHCMKPYTCAFFDYCKCQRGVPKDEPTVFDLYRMNFSKKLEHYHAGRITFEALRSEKLSDKQQMQMECTLNGTKHINPNGIREFLDALSYPLYFLDFETMQDAVPQYDGTKPYQQITFQYSLHIKESADAPYQHKEYLAPSDGKDPRRGLAEQLCKDIPMNVCTLAYNKGFECGRIKELAALFPDLAVHLMNIQEHIQDLLTPFQNGYYYVPAMGGSFSIKSVLPALFPDDRELNYHNLDERCQNGGNAMTLFPKLAELQQRIPKLGLQKQENGMLVLSDSLMKLSDIQAIQKEIAADREALLRYCELDTWAMVKVWEKLGKKAK